MNRKHLSDNLITLVIVLSMAASLLTGCDVSDIPGASEITELLGMSDDAEAADAGKTSAGNDAEGTGSSSDRIAVYDQNGDEITAEESVINMMEDADDDEEFISAADLVSQSGSLFDNTGDYYIYSCLDSTEQSVYKEIYAIITEMKDEVELSVTDKDTVDYCFRCVLADHPEIFYVSGYSINKYLMGDEVKKLTFSGTYTMSKAEVENKKPLIEDYADRALRDLSASASDYEKVKYVYEYLINNNTYDMSSDNNQNILSVVENGVTVCQGYAKMTQLLLNRLGIFCTLVNGRAKSGITQADDGTIYDNSGSDNGYYTDEDGWGSHVWNIVKADGQYYNVDTTWGDASFLFTDGESEGYVQGPELNYDYLMVPDSMILDTHRPGPIVEMPECTSMDDNYYVREGLYFTSVDSNQLKAAFENAYAGGGMFVTLKCSDSSVYEDMKNYLFQKEKVFDYLSGTSVRYVEYEDRSALTIYL